MIQIIPNILGAQAVLQHLGNYFQTRQIRENKTVVLHTKFFKNKLIFLYKMWEVRIIKTPKGRTNTEVQDCILLEACSSACNRSE